MGNTTSSGELLRRVEGEPTALMVKPWRGKVARDDITRPRYEELACRIIGEQNQSIITQFSLQFF